MDDAPDAPDGKAPAPLRRSVLVGLAIGLGVGLAAIGVAYAIVAIPAYALAQSDPNGLDRPIIRDALFRVGLPAGVVVGLLIGVVVGVWYRRGGHFPTDRTPF
jgi:hypothetical protein